MNGRSPKTSTWVFGLDHSLEIEVVIYKIINFQKNVRNNEESEGFESDIKILQKLEYIFFWQNNLHEQFITVHNSLSRL